MPKFLIEVSFHAPTIEVEVEAEDMKAAWEMRYEVAVKAEPEEFESRPISICEVD